MKACVLLKVRPGRERAVADQASKVMGVRFAFVALGRFDVVASGEAGYYPALEKLVDDLNRIEAVVASETLLAVEVR
jgi:uncharacterized protein with GYD domain